MLEEYQTWALNNIQFWIDVIAPRLYLRLLLYI